MSLREQDVQPALGAGMAAYWITEPDQEPPVNAPGLVGQGSLSDFYRWITGQGT